MRRRLVAGVGVIVLAGAVFAVDRTQPFGFDLAHPFGTPTPVSSTDGISSGTALAKVTRRSLSAQTTMDGTLGYAGSYNVVNQARGVVTSLPTVGQLVRRGEILYRVDGAPVVLLYGSSPVYRALAAGADASDVSGQDVRQLNANLVALGYATAAQLDPDSDEFGWRTTRAVKKLQADLGVEETGKLELGQVIFVPGALRVTATSAMQGAPIGPGGPVLQASSTARVVTVKLATTQRSQLKVGDSVTITLPDGKTTPGRVTSVGKVATAPASGSGSPTVDVSITPTNQAATGSLDKAPVKIGITTAKIKDALVVPVEALLALAGGGYALELVSAEGTHRLLPVKMGLFDDDAGVVQVIGAGLAAGQQVVVPSS
ncbi:efflux RND transporter periplasmic adaptor subunit [Kribbella sp. NPDC004536]|uniref:efflux RND transporter periplasmic adaptor subunit n=1 Tax=Kribbella sp. NPDC004536 TaxID=3364106 RepID=UPI0036AE8C5A